MIRILLVEDDHLQRETIRAELMKIPRVEVDVIGTERSFRRSLESIRTDPPDFIVLDVGLVWDHFSDDWEVPPPDVKKTGFKFAGLRCEKRLREHPSTSDIPVLLYTVWDLDELDVTPEEQERLALMHLAKDDNLEPLRKEVARRIDALANGNEQERRS